MWKMWRQHQGQTCHPQRVGIPVWHHLLVVFEWSCVCKLWNFRGERKEGWGQGQEEQPEETGFNPGTS